MRPEKLIVFPLKPNGNAQREVDLKDGSTRGETKRPSDSQVILIGGRRDPSASVFGLQTGLDFTISLKTSTNGVPTGTNDTIMSSQAVSILKGHRRDPDVLQEAALGVTRLRLPALRRAVASRQISNTATTASVAH